MQQFDCVIVGGGILGTSIAYWLSQIYEGKIVVLEMEPAVACHTSGRNTGVIHRPFYLNPEKRKIFAQSAQISYGLWKQYAQQKNLPWQEVRTIEVATQPQELKILEKYVQWARQNGMRPDEVEYLTPDAVKKLEPNVECLGAVHVKTDTAVDYRQFTESLMREASANGIEFKFNTKVKSVQIKNKSLVLHPGGDAIETAFLINCAGGNSIDIAHLMGVGMEYTDLHFRGEYWEISPEKSGLVNTNIYSVPRHGELPFLDPHWIVRANGKREIGPNAVLVAGCQTYQGFFTNFEELLAKIFEPPMKNKFNLFRNPEFLTLAWEEWRSSIYKSMMVKRVQRFIPKLEAEDLIRPGTAGIRSAVIDKQGQFIREALEMFGPSSFHITNYNSPGATGAPAYTALVVDKLSKQGVLSHIKKRSAPLKSIWNFTDILKQF